MNNEITIVYNTINPVNRLAALLLTQKLKKACGLINTVGYKYFNDYVNDNYNNLTNAVISLGFSINLEKLPRVQKLTKLYIYNPYLKKVSKKSTRLYNNWSIVVKDSKTDQNITIFDLIDPKGTARVVNEKATLADMIRFFEYLPLDSSVNNYNNQDLRYLYSRIFNQDNTSNLWSLENGTWNLYPNEPYTTVELPEYQWFNFNTQKILIADNKDNYQLSRLIPNANQASAIITLQFRINKPSVARFLNVQKGNVAQQWLKAYHFSIPTNFENTKTGYALHELNWSALFNLIQKE